MDIMTYNAIQNIKSHPDWLNYLLYMNDGVDGNYTPSVTGVLTSGVYRYDTVTINSGVTITPSSNYLIILAKTSITINGSISANGKGSIGGAKINSTPGVSGIGLCGAGGGSGAIAVYSGGTNNGNIGGATDVSGGSGGIAVTNPGGATGGTGGAGSSIGKTLSMHSSLRDIITYKGAGGGSGSDTTGGTGGTGGGAIILISPTISGSGTITANGDIGGTGSNIAGQAGGGGGGGGGGFVFLSSKSLTITAANITANGGNGGTGGVSYYSGAYFYGGVGGVGGAGAVLKTTY